VNTVEVRPRRLSRWLAASLATLLAVSGLAAVSPAAAAPETVTGGELTWGVAADYRGAFATRTVGSPATLDSVADSFTFPATTTSTWSADTESGTLAFQGNAQIGYFAGRPNPGVTAGNYFYLSNPTVVITGTTGTISGLTAGDSHSLNPLLPTAALSSRTVANLDLSTPPTINPDGTLITWANVPATLTEAGADVLAEYVSDPAAPTRRTAGDALDPVTITLRLVEETAVSLTVPPTTDLGDDVDLQASVTPADASGSVEFFDGETSLGSAAVVAGMATSTVALPVGPHSVTATFIPSDSLRYGASSSQASTIDVRIDDAKISWPFSVYAEGWSLSVSGGVTALPAPTGKASGGFTLNNGSGGIDPATGVEQLSFPGSVAYAMYPSLAPEAQVNLTDFVLTFAAGRAGGTLTADVSVGTAPTTVSQDVVIAEFGISDSHLVVNPDGLLAVTEAPAYVGALGSHAPYVTGYTDTWPTAFVDAVKSGAAVFGQPVNTIQSFFYKSGTTAAQANKPPQPLRISYGEAITPISTATSLASSASTALPGGGITLTATVAPAASGTVEFFDGSTSLGSAPASAGSAALGLTNLTMGVHSYRAVFTPFNALAASGSTSGDTIVTVQIQNASVTWPFSVYAEAWSLSVSGDVTALPAPSGKASGGFTLTNGVGVIDPVTGAGTLEFAGTASYAMYPTLALDARVNLSDFALIVEAGQARGTLIADVSVGATPATTVEDVVIARFEIDGSNLYATADAFKAVTDAPAYLNALGSHTPYATGYTDTWPTGFVDAVKSGAAVFGPPVNTIQSFFYKSGTTAAQANKPPQPLTIAYGAAVTAAATTTALSAGAPVVNVGATAALVAAVTPAVEGTVEFFDDGHSLGSAPVVAGTATFDASSLAEGQHSFTARFTPANRISALSSVSGAVTVDVVVPTTIPASAPAGSLQWGVKASYREYITGPIAQGSVSVSEGASASGSRYGFPQAGDSSYNTATGTGSTSYRGAVRFFGHDGLIDMTVSDPIVRVTSSSRAVLSAVVSGRGRIDLGYVDLAAASRSTVGGSITYSNAPVTLAASGVPVFERYPEGEAMDPLTFTIGTASAASAPAAATVSSFVAPRTAAATPPATEGITVTSSNPTAGKEITVEAEGFEPNETGILVVIYSDPVVLARDASADATGKVTWTGTLPANLTGEHTLTFQGSVNRGVVLDIAANVTTAAMSCPVDDATLTWGFKESFRSYISGSIANGEWTVADGASYATPDFSWSDGEGSYEDGGVVAFTGSITFTGHGGILNTTVANPQVKFIDEDTAVLLMDVSGTTQDGAEVNSPAVEFVELDLSTATTDDTDGVITITGAPAVLTAAGSAAFGTYETGEEFDPVSFTIETGAACESAAAPTDEATTAADPVAASSVDLWWILWLALALAVIAVVVVILVRRRAHTA